MKKNLKKQNLKQIKKLNKEFDGKSPISILRNQVEEPFTVPPMEDMDPKEYMDLMKYVYNNTTNWEVRWAIREKFPDINKN